MSRSPSMGSTMAVDDSARPAPSTMAPCQPIPTRWASPARASGGRHHLPGAQAEHRAPHHPQALRAQFDADQEQQHDHAEFGDFRDLVVIIHQARPDGPMTAPAIR